MFESIRNIFRKFLALDDLQRGLTRWRGSRVEEDDDWAEMRDQYDFSGMDWGTSPSWSIGRYEHLTQRDLQMLTHIVSKHIKAADQVRKDLKEEALEYEVGDDLRNILFGEHREVKAYLKKLAALQYRLKHKIAARG